jgi:hypothetical protein
VIVITCYVIDVLRWSQAIYVGKPCIQIDDRRQVRLTPVHAGSRIWTDAVGKKFVDWFVAREKWKGKEMDWTNFTRKESKVSNDTNRGAVV